MRRRNQTVKRFIYLGVVGPGSRAEHSRLHCRVPWGHCSSAVLSDGHGQPWEAVNAVLEPRVGQEGTAGGGEPLKYA